MIVYMVSRMVHLKWLKINFVAHTVSDDLVSLLLCARILFFSCRYSIDSDDEILCSLFFFTFSESETCDYMSNNRFW